MGPHQHKDRVEYGHDIEGYMYKVIIKDNEEVERIKMEGQRVAHVGGETLNLGIKAMKRQNRSSKERQAYKEHVWTLPDLARDIQLTALKSPEKKKANKKVMKPVDN